MATLQTEQHTYWPQAYGSKVMMVDLQARITVAERQACITAGLLTTWQELRLQS